MGENKIKRQSWDSNQIWMTIHSLLTGLHVGPLKQDSLIREQNSWGISNILQLINLYPSSLGMRCYLRCFWTLTLSVFYPLLCVPRKGNPPLILGSHTGSPDIAGLVPTSSFRCHPTGTDSTTSKWVHLTPQMTPKVNGTKHWVILCQLLNLSDLSGAWHRVSVWGSFVEGIEWREGGRMSRL